MKIGVVSDTHRNTALLCDVTQWLVRECHIVELYHLGDDYEDVAELDLLGIDIVHVPGIYHKKYRDGSISAKLIENILGLRIMLLHSIDKDFTFEDSLSSDIVLHGHTHKPEIKLDNGKVILNPGHLKSAIDKQTPASFVLLDISDRNVVVTFYNIEYEEVNKVTFIRSGSGLYKS